MVGGWQKDSQRRSERDEPITDSTFRIGGRCYSTADDLLAARRHRPRSGVPNDDD